MLKFATIVNHESNANWGTREFDDCIQIGGGLLIDHESRGVFIGQTEVVFADCIPLAV
jgi:serine acetyltransferase